MPCSPIQPCTPLPRRTILQPAQPEWVRDFRQGYESGLSHPKNRAKATAIRRPNRRALNAAPVPQTRAKRTRHTATNRTVANASPSVVSFASMRLEDYFKSTLRNPTELCS